MNDPVPKKTFVLISMGYSFFLLSTGMLSFIVLVLIYRETKNIYFVSLLALCDKVPGIIMSFFAGYIADHFPKKRVLTVSTGASIVNCLWFYPLFNSNNLNCVYVYLFIIIMAILRVTMDAAHKAAIPFVIGNVKMKTANGINQLLLVMSSIVASISGGCLITAMNDHQIIKIAIVMYGASLLSFSFLLMRNDCVETISDNGIEERNSSEQFNSRTILKNIPLVHLISYVAIVNFIIGITNVVFNPMILGFCSEKQLGIVLSIGNIGACIGGTVNVTSKRIQSSGKLLLAVGLLEGIFLIACGFSGTMVAICISLFMLYFCFPLFGSCIQTLWYMLVPNRIIGQVLGIKNTIVWASITVSYALSPIIVDMLVKPSIRFMNILEGREYQVTLMLLGTLMIIVSMMGFKKTEIRKIISY